MVYSHQIILSGYNRRARLRHHYIRHFAQVFTGSEESTGLISAEYLPSIYMPIDRWDALAHDRVLSERTVGTALFADISGFTPLTEALTNAFGARRGAEELTIHLNTVYTALIAEVHRYHGSVIGFSGDAITCWFDGLDVPAEHSVLRATACAQRMQQAMQTFDAVPLPNGGTVSLSVK